MEEDKEKRHDHYLVHKELFKANNKKYRTSHREKVNAKAREYHREHREAKLKRYCSDIEEIENFCLAKADNFAGWDIHHRLETHNSDDERRTVYLSSKELIALGTYYDRPASELIFLKHGDHMRLHRLSQHNSSETRAKIAAAHRGKHLSVETRAKMREAAKHKAPVSAETRAKQSAARKGKHFSDETRCRHNTNL